jgi:mRNA-degrading endonuclease RelE of RelBE toxin-antitoxin system
MIYTFYETPLFTRRIAELLDDETYRQLQNELQENPAKGEVMQGCGGIRKVRLEAPKRRKGKRGGFRVIYLHVPEARCIYFVTIYGKDEQDDLAGEQKRVLKAIAEQTKETLRRKQRRKGKD